MSDQLRVFISLPGEVTPERLIAKRVVEAFKRHWFVDEQAGSFKAASQPFQNTGEFEELLKMHM